MAIEILLADERAEIRSSLRSILALEPDLRIVGECSGLVSSLELVAKLKPDVIIADFSRTGFGDCQPIKKLSDCFPSVALIILTIQDWEDNRQKVSRAGAVGLVSKFDDMAVLLDTIRKASGKSAI